MTQGYVRSSRWEDIPALADNMREADMAEVMAAAGLGPTEALFQGMMAGDTSVICLPDDTPVGVFGVHPSPVKGLGIIWMLATNDFKLLHRQFLRECRKGLIDYCRPYRAVFNYTDARNSVHHRWIDWAGFTFIKRHEEFGFEKRPFLEFVRITEVPDV